MAVGYGAACPKPEPRKKTQARKQREDTKALKQFRDDVWAREATCDPSAGLPVSIAVWW